MSLNILREKKNIHLKLQNLSWKA